MPISPNDEKPARTRQWAQNGSLNDMLGILTHLRKSHKNSYVASKRSRSYALVVRSLVDWIRKKMGGECCKTDYISFLQQFTWPKEP